MRYNATTYFKDRIELHERLWQSKDLHELFKRRLELKDLESEHHKHITIDVDRLSSALTVGR